MASALTTDVIAPLPEESKDGFDTLHAEGTVEKGNRPAALDTRFGSEPRRASKMISSDILSLFSPHTTPSLSTLLASDHILPHRLLGRTERWSKSLRPPGSCTNEHSSKAKWVMILIERPTSHHLTASWEYHPVACVCPDYGRYYPQWRTGH